MLLQQQSPMITAAVTGNSKGTSTETPGLFQTSLLAVQNGVVSEDIETTESSSLFTGLPEQFVTDLTTLLEQLVTSIPENDESIPLNEEMITKLDLLLKSLTENKPAELEDVLPSTDKESLDANIVLLPQEVIVQVEALLKDMTEEQQVDSESLKLMLETLTADLEVEIDPTIYATANFYPVQLQFNEPVNKELNVQNLTAQKTVINEQAAQLLANVETTTDMQKVAPKLLKLLEQLTAIEKQLNFSGNNVDSNGNIGKDSEKLNAVWKELVQGFQKREAFNTKQLYQTEAKVTSSDVVKWLQNAVENNITTEKVVVVQQPVVQTIPMAKLEQYVVHVNEKANHEAPDGELMKQFDKAIKTSRFLAVTNGNSQLSISLRPDHLGDMTVKFTKIDGEMLVKIMVSTEGAKKMLEANMHQLRNTFAPHQVLIEKQEIQVFETQEVQKEQESPLEDEENNSEQTNKQNEQTQEGKSFEATFNELLNERV